MISSFTFQKFNPSHDEAGRFSSTQRVDGPKDPLHTGSLGSDVTSRVDLQKSEFSRFEFVKYNPYHDSKGRFATSQGASTFSFSSRVRGWELGTKHPTALDTSQMSAETTRFPIAPSTLPKNYQGRVDYVGKQSREIGRAIAKIYGDEKTTTTLQGLVRVGGLRGRTGGRKNWDCGIQLRTSVWGMIEKTLRGGESQWRSDAGGSHRQAAVDAFETLTHEILHGVGNGGGTRRSGYFGDGVHREETLVELSAQKLWPKVFKSITGFAPGGGHEPGISYQSTIRATLGTSAENALANVSERTIVRALLTTDRSSHLGLSAGIGKIRESYQEETGRRLSKSVLQKGEFESVDRLLKMISDEAPVEEMFRFWEESCSKATGNELEELTGYGEGLSMIEEAQQLSKSKIQKGEPSLADVHVDRFLGRQYLCPVKGEKKRRKPKTKFSFQRGQQ